jgi:hypothetical protein
MLNGEWALLLIYFDSLNDVLEINTMNAINNGQ